MAKTRIDLQRMLEEVLGSRNVYFQPPESIKLKYPAIIYSRSAIESEHANNNKYMKHTKYQAIVVDQDPESEIIDKMLELPMCSYVRSYASENLNHDVFEIYI